MKVEDWKTLGLCLSAVFILFLWARNKAIKSQARSIAREEIEKFKKEQEEKALSNTATSPE